MFEIVVPAGKTFLRLFCNPLTCSLPAVIAIKLLNSVVDCVRLARAVVINVLMSSAG